jgi:hypothetical protein
VGIILVTREASTTCMFVCTYVCKEEKRSTTTHREGNGRGMGVTSEGRKEERKIIHISTKLTHKSTLRCYRVPSNDYDRPLSNVPSLLQVKAPVTRTKRQRHVTLSWVGREGDRENIYALRNAII